MSKIKIKKNEQGQPIKYTHYGEDKKSSIYNIDVNYIDDYTILTVYYGFDNATLRLKYKDGILESAKDLDTNVKYAVTEYKDNKRILKVDQIVNTFTNLDRFIEEFKEDKYLRMYIRNAKPFTQWYTIEVFEGNMEYVYHILGHERGKQYISCYEEVDNKEKRKLLWINAGFNRLSIVRFSYENEICISKEIEYEYKEEGLPMSYLYNMDKVIEDFKDKPTTKSIEYQD